MLPSPFTIVRKYTDSVLSGELPSCLMVRLAVERWASDLKRCELPPDDPDALYLDRDFARRMTLFIRGFDVGYTGLKHYKGEWAGRNFEPEPWEWFILINIFCLRVRATRLRKYTYADVYVPRKNGKTTLAAVIALIMLMIDGEPAAEVYSFAVDKEQAKICFDTALHIAKASGLLEDGTLQYFKSGTSIVFPESASTFKPLSKETGNKDGLNPSCGIGDECHAWRTFEMKEVVQTGMGARKEPLLFQISTAGMDTSYPYFSHLEYLRQVITGILQKDNHFILLYEPDKDDPWDSEDTWAKVNPNYGVSLSCKYMRESCQEAKQKGGTTLVAFQTKNLNMWVDAPEVWIPDDQVAANNKDFDEKQLEGEDCYVGIDLAATGDITATCLFFPRYMVVKFIFIVPQSKLEEDSGRGDIVDYRLWVEQGWLVVCPGKILSLDWYALYMMNELPHYNIKGIGYDPWNAWELKSKMGRYQEQMVVWNQGIKYMYPPSKKIFELTTEGEFNFLNNPIIRWMFKNVVIYMDPNNNYKPDKGRSRSKIDGVVALCDSIGIWLNESSGETKEIYVDHTIRTMDADDDESWRDL